MAKEKLIAVIDDDSSLRAALSELLGSVGYRADGYGSADEFIEAAQPASYDCIISDIHMPGMNGLELQQRLSNQGNRVPVVMITGRGDPGLTERVTASGALCLLIKPIEADTLLGSLQKAMHL